MTQLESNTAEAKNLINELGINILTAFHFDKNVTQNTRFQKIKDRLLETKDGFLLDPEYLNVLYLLEREAIQGNIKLFVESMSPKAICSREFSY